MGVYGKPLEKLKGNNFICIERDPKFYHLSFGLQLKNIFIRQTHELPDILESG